uniref:NADH-ubiquinone oxidoreductase chain 4 n=1 Tax=Cerceris quinquefasciata TaxID=2026451 RepID=A0A8B0JV36_9HYME|nr:NADH dehydrogenase subunit 4 [Cerceris quinquefasciata]QTV22619.1 NADH dehydrogenase subunit 4 [Cerceris quinquefasciata]
MMKFLIFSLMMMFCKKINFLQNMIFLMSFFMIFNMVDLNYYLISMNFGLNFYSYGLIMLVFWITGLMLLSVKFVNNKYICSLMIMLLMIILMVTFSNLNFFLFYLFFEVSLVPTFIMIIYWGLGSQRILASYYFLFYTMIFSLPMILILFELDYVFGSLSLLLNKYYSLNLEEFYMIIMLMCFLVKVPFYLMHSWLLKAHVEAPVFGSMILASLLLKLGGYGLLLMLNLMYDYFNENFKNNLILISLMGSLVLSIICMCQIDLKILVAYSSIVHMGMMLCGIFSMMKLGILGSYMMMISHGFSSSGLFYLVNINYERLNSRLIYMNKGMLSLMPSMGLMWFLLCSSNMAAPFSLNLVSEIFLIIIIMIYNIKLMILMILVCMFSFIYSLYLFSWIQHGKFMKMNKFSSGKLLEYLNLLLHWIPLNIMIFNLNVLIS